MSGSHNIWGYTNVCWLMIKTTIHMTKVHAHLHYDTTAQGQGCESSFIVSTYVGVPFTPCKNIYATFTMLSFARY